MNGDKEGTIDSWKEGEETFRLMKGDPDTPRYDRQGHAGWRWTLTPGNEGTVARRHAWLVEELAGERECHEEAARGLHHASEKNAELEAKLQEVQLIRESQGREIANCRRELMEQKGVWRLALADADILRASLGTLSKIAESAGWTGEEPLAEWLGPRLQEAIELRRAYSRVHREEIESLKARVALLDRVVALAIAHGFASPFTLDADPTISLEDFLASKIAHNSRIAHQHSEQVRSLDTKLVQEGQRITLLKVRFQELRDLLAEALEI